MMKLELSPARMAQAIYSRSLLYFVAVAETGSIREASRRLNVAASAVSRQLSHLQDRLGVKLFDNMGHSLRLAPAGHELLRYCRAILEDLDPTVDAISSLHGYRTGTVRIATIDSFATTLLAELISGFSRDFPSIHLSLSIHSAKDVATQVAEGFADVGFAFNVKDRDLFRILLKAEFPMGIVVSDTHPLARKSCVTYQECVGYPIGLLKPGTSIRTALEQASTRASLPWPKYVEATSMRLLEDLARVGRHVTFQPRYRFTSGFRKSSLIFIPLDDPPRTTDEFAMIVDRRLQLRPAPKEFVSFAKRFLSERLEKTQ
ncbi:MAG: LysR family transcriptional regulator [Rhizobiales bacterium]|nr:LysR family transcriptional regulator [Hyphomicrobiales bacterium]